MFGEGWGGRVGREGEEVKTWFKALVMFGEGWGGMGRELILSIEKKQRGLVDSLNVESNHP